MTGITCQEEVGDTTPVDLPSQSGLFIITGAMCGLGLIMAVVRLLMSSSAGAMSPKTDAAAPHASRTDSEMLAPMTEGEMLRNLMEEVALLREGLGLNNAAGPPAVDKIRSS